MDHPIGHASVCDVVVAMTRSTVQHLGADSPSDRLVAALLVTMPEYTRLQRLDAWESAITEVAPWPPKGETGELLSAIFEFGRCNLYAAFNLKYAADEFSALVRRLRGAGVELPPLQPPVRY
jgi:hypothetical protein